MLAFPMNILERDKSSELLSNLKRIGEYVIFIIFSVFICLSTYGRGKNKKNCFENVLSHNPFDSVIY